MATPVHGFCTKTNGAGRNRHSAHAGVCTLHCPRGTGGSTVIQPEKTADIRSQHPLWDERDAVGRRAIVDCLTRRLPVTIASIILLNDERTHFVQEVWSGRLDLDQPQMPWPVSNGAAGRCVRTGQAQLITDMGGDPDYVPGHREVNSEYLVPIRHRGRLHG